jgi:S1-C subfamily serine protease
MSPQGSSCVLRRATRLTIAVAVLCANAGSAKTLAEVVQSNHTSVVYIRVEKVAESTGAVTDQHGSGFIVSAGYLVTAAHLVSSGPGFQVDVRGATGSREGTLEALEVVYENSNFDVAVLRFRNTALDRRPVALGDPWKVSADATIYAMGFPGTEEWFHTEGRLSGTGPKGSWSTTAVLNPGMSGGPIFNTDGEVVAMTWGGVANPGVAGISRVLPINLLSDAFRVSGSQVAVVAHQGVDVPYHFGETQESLNGFEAASRGYSHTFVAKEGFKIVDFRYVPRSANNASEPRILVSPDGKRLDVDFALTSGPIYDQWRGWIDAEILTKQEPD